MVERGQWHETLHDQLGQCFVVDNVLYHEETDHQDLITFENVVPGRVMALDDVVQTTERDEFIYHEMMTHIPLLARGYARRVPTIDGGSDVMLREVIRHKDVEPITMVEIDAGAVSFCHQYLPDHNTGSYSGPCFRLVVDDGVNFINQTSQTFDVIISDCTDPIGPGESLFTSASYEGCRRCLNPGGIFVVQSGVYFLQQEETIDSHHKLSHCFNDVDFYQAVVLTYYGGIMTFAWATDSGALRHLSAEIIQTRFLASGPKCHYYNPATHTAVFALPRYPQGALTSQPSQEEDKKLKKLRLHGSSNLTKNLSSCIYDIYYAKTAEERDGYIAYTDELCNVNRLTEILSETYPAIGVNTLNIARQDYEPQGASVTILVSEKSVDPRLTGKTKHPGPLPETVVVHLDKSHICVYTYPESHPEGGLCTFRIDIKVSTCDAISPLKALNYLIHQLGSDIVTVDYRMCGFTRDISGMKRFIDHKINSIQSSMSNDMKTLYDIMDVNIYQEDIFHTEMLLEGFGLEHCMSHARPEDLTDSERQETTAMLWKETCEIHYGRNMPAV